METVEYQLLICHSESFGFTQDKLREESSLRRSPAERRDPAAAVTSPDLRRDQDDNSRKSYSTVSYIHTPPVFYCF